MSSENKKELTNEEFEKELKTVDWYYQRADDPSAYRRGKASYHRVRELAIGNRVHTKMFLDIAQKKF